MKTFSEYAVEDAVLNVLDHIIIGSEPIGYQRDALTPTDVASRVLVELGVDND